MNKKEFAIRYRALFKTFCAIYNLPSLLWRVERKQIVAPCALIKNLKIHIAGNNNKVIIEDFSRLKNCSIHIYGNDNRIVIGTNSNLINTDLWIEDDHNEIIIGEKTCITGKTHLAAIEGTKISIGKNCLFSSNIHFQTGDSHSILDLTGKRINKSEDISIGDHVWVGTKVTCLKGVRVPPHSIIGACAVLTEQFLEENTVLAGVPARVVKKGVRWSGKRIPVGEVASDFGLK